MAKSKKKGSMPDPADYADRFSEAVANWQQLNNQWREAERNRATWFDQNTGLGKVVTPWDIRQLNALEWIMHRQQQFNAMVVAAIDELKKDWTHSLD